MVLFILIYLLIIWRMFFVAVQHHPRNISFWALIYPANYIADKNDCYYPQLLLWIKVISV